jgi:ribonuclease T1
VFFVVSLFLRGLISKLVLTGIFLGTLGSPILVQARQSGSSGNTSSLSVAELPRQGVETYEKIHQGGPFPYEKDGVVFGNRERLLPAEKRGYYREYTVKTPGSSNRGARRIVCGGQPKKPDACYYTADHYSSFRKIVP